MCFTSGWNWYTFWGPHLATRPRWRRWFSIIGYHTEAPVTALNETIIMLAVLALIDVVIVGGYETFVSRMDLDGHPDQPEWLSHVNASVLKVKLGRPSST